MKTVKGWFLRQWYRFNKPYEVDYGEFGQKGWINKKEPKLVNTTLSFAELNAARILLGDLPTVVENEQANRENPEELTDWMQKWYGIAGRFDTLNHTPTI
ncbi:hypothetical protein LCGC14_0264060 [marine sediment metagenome]|uniref:Uncharacterized protein n=1 Tax=marine sediment metagenome TaxID=412755 RepID=A0A0F9UHN9_9ZZZZ